MDSTRIKRFSITCSNMPNELFEKTEAKKYFQQFGHVIRMYLRPKRKSCTIEYDSPESAERALYEGGIYKNDEFQIEWTPAEKKIRKRIIKTEEEADPSWPEDPDVRAELEAMTNEYTNKKFNLRPEPMNVDKNFTPKPLRKKSTMGVKKKEKTVASKSLSLELLNELITIIKKPAFSAEEKYQILEARDKLIRLHTVKESDISKAKKTLGTCPDMCPEKERLMREAKHQVAMYEQMTNSRGETCMNHKIAIKQYSRSSADQETPLPHDLRPVSVLQLTMNYLLSNIISFCDSPDVNLAEWFHYIWDRTRGIRKDITQQQLCCPGSVELVEQCARFHIHCSARLVAEDVSVFDQKINTENLTKCLQTLKYMYNDLAIKNIDCPNEAEFRGYIVLLNLGDGNFMWEVQQLKSEIQKSPEVRFAIKVFIALDNNNYVSFFKLVRSTTYLNACLLHRYFNQVRFRAIERIIKTYSARLIVTQMPVSELTYMLAFEDTDATLSFLDFHGLCFNDDQSYVILDRKSLIELPASNFVSSRANNVIESKRACSVGEVVCGKKLPAVDFENHILHDSFDEKGFLKSSEIDSEWNSNIKQSIASTKTKISETGKTSPSLGMKESTTKTVSLFPAKDMVDNKTEKFINPFAKPNIFGDSLKKPSLFGSTTSKTSDHFQKQEIVTKSTNLFTSSTQQTSNASLFEKQPQTSLFSNQAVKPTSNLFGMPAIPKSTNLFSSKENEPNKSTIMFKPFQPVPSKPETVFSNFDKTSSNQKQTTTVTSSPSTIFSTFIKQSMNKEPDNKLKEELKNVNFSFQPMKPTVNLEENKLAEEQRLKELKAQKEAQEQEQKIQEEIKKRRLEEERKRWEEEQKKREEEWKKQEEERRKKEAEHKKQMEIKKKLEDEERERQREMLLRAKLIEQMKQKQLKQEQERIEELERKKAVKVLLSELVNHVIDIEINEKVEILKKKIIKRKILNCTRRWQKNIVTIKKKRKAVEDLPVWIAKRSINEEAAELYTPSQSLVLSNMKRYKVGTPQLAFNALESELPRINVLFSTYTNIKSRLQKLGDCIVNNIFWKVFLCVHNINTESYCLQFFEDVLNNAFVHPKDTNYLVLKNFKPNRSDSYTVCIEKVNGDIKSVNQKADFVFLGVNNKYCLAELQSRLYNFITKKPKMSRPPIVILLKRSNENLDKSTIERELQLGQLVFRNVISNYLILLDNFGTKKNILSLLENGLSWLAANTENSPPLEVDYLSSILNSCLGNELEYRLLYNSKTNNRLKLALSLPEFVINLHNEAISTLTEMLSSENVIKYPNFPDEFKSFLEPVSYYPQGYEYFPNNWKNSAYLNNLKKEIQSLSFSFLSERWPSKNTNEIVEYLQNYCMEYLGSFYSEKIYFKCLSVVLKHFETDKESQEQFDLKIVSFPWLKIIQILITYKLENINFRIPMSSSIGSNITHQLVIYDRHRLKDNRNFPWWFHRPSLNKIITSIEERKIENSDKKVNKHMKLELDFDLDRTLSEISNLNDSKTSHLEKRKKPVYDIKSSFSELETTIELHRKAQEKFNEILKKELENDFMS